MILLRLALAYVAIAAYLALAFTVALLIIGLGEAIVVWLLGRRGGTR